MSAWERVAWPEGGVVVVNTSGRFERQAAALDAVELDAVGPADPDAVELIFTGDIPRPAVDGFGSARCRLADRAAGQLLEPLSGTAASDALIGEHNALVSRMPELAGVLAAAPAVAEHGPDSAVRVRQGRGGVVVRLHGDRWSLVLRVNGRVLVVLDSMPEVLWRVDRDEGWWSEVDAMVEAVLQALDRRAQRSPGPVRT